MQYLPLFVYMVVWLAFRAICVYTQVLSDFGDTGASTCMFVSVVNWLRFRAHWRSTYVLSGFW